MNPSNLFTYEPLNKKNLSLPAKIFVWFLEYIARVLAAIYVSICLLLVSLWPRRSASKAFFRIIGNVADLYRSKWMGDEYAGQEKNTTESMDKADGDKIPRVEAKK